MKKVLALLAALSIATPGWAAIARVQTCQDSYPTADLATLSCSTTAGNLYIACVQTGTGASPTLTSANMTLNAIGTVTNAGGSLGTCYYALNISGGTNSVVLHKNGNASSTGFVAVEYSGVSSFDVSSSSAVTTNTATPTTNSFITTGTDLIFAFYSNNVSGIPNTAGTNYTLIQKNLSAFDATEEWIGAPVGTNTASFNLSAASAASVLVVMAFSPPSSKGGQKTDSIFSGGILGGGVLGGGVVGSGN